MRKVDWSPMVANPRATADFVVRLLDRSLFVVLRDVMQGRGSLEECVRRECDGTPDAMQADGAPAELVEFVRGVYADAEPVLVKRAAQMVRVGRDRAPLKRGRRARIHKRERVDV